MRRFLLTSFIFVAFLSSFTALSKEPSTPLSIVPVQHDASWAVDWWLPRHEEKLQELKDRNFDIDLVFLGDSITHGWESKGNEYWQEYYGDRKAFNLGFGGDRTEHVLWRLQNGAVEGISPKLLVLMIGTNNTGHRQDPASETTLGISTIISEIKTRLPSTKILLLAIFPRAELPSDPLRQLNQKINKEIKSLADDETVFWADINHLFLDEKGVLSKTVMKDLLHPEGPQYKIWAEAVEPHMEKFLQ